jgi:hypothetical protein
LTEKSDSEESQSIKYDIISDEESIKVAPTKQPAKKQVSISDVVTVYDKEKTNPVAETRVTKSETPIIYTEVTTPTESQRDPNTDQESSIKVDTTE